MMKLRSKVSFRLAVLVGRWQTRSQAFSPLGENLGPIPTTGGSLDGQADDRSRCQAPTPLLSVFIIIHEQIGCQRPQRELETGIVAGGAHRPESEVSVVLPDHLARQGPVVGVFIGEREHAVGDGR